MSGQAHAAVSTTLLGLLGAMAAIAPISTDMYLPAFPAIREDLSLQSGQVELSFSAYFVGMFLGMLCYGPVSDAFGRKRPLVFGLTLYCIAGTAITVSQDLAELVFWRFLQGLGGCSGAVLAFAIIRDRCDASQSARTISLMMLIMGAAPMLAPVFGGFVLSTWGWKAIFLFLAAFGALLLASVLALYRDSGHFSSRDLVLGTTLRSYGQLLRAKPFIIFVGIQSLVMGAMFTYIIGSPLVLLNIHKIAPNHFGFFFGVNALGIMVSSQVNRLLLAKYPPRRILSVALWLPLLGGVLLVINALLPQSTLWLILPGFFISVASVGFVNPNASAMAMANEGHRAGKASAVLNCGVFGSGMLAGLLLSLTNDGTVAPVSWIILACALGAVLTFKQSSSEPKSFISSVR